MLFFFFPKGKKHVTKQNPTKKGRKHQEKPKERMRNKKADFLFP